MRQTLSSGLTNATITRISILVLLSIIDYTLTCYAIRTGLASEGNPVLSWLPLEGIGILKTVGVLILIYRHWNGPRVLYFVSGVLLAVVCWNLGVIL